MKVPNLVLSDIYELERDTKRLTDLVIESNVSKMTELGEIFAKDLHAAISAVDLMLIHLRDWEVKS